MGKKNDLENLVSSVFGSYLDPEDSEVLDKNEETEKKWEKILYLVNAEDIDASATSLNKSELTTLIGDIHTGYQSLYGRYALLTDNLKKNIKHKKLGNGRLSLTLKSSESSSSGSGSSDSDDDRSSNNHQGKEAEVDEIQAAKNVLENDLQSLRKSFEALRIENEGLQRKINGSEKEKSLEDLISKLEAEKEVLNRGLEERAEDVAMLHKKLDEIAGKKEADEAKLKVKFDELSSRITELSAENEGLKVGLEDGRKREHELSQKLGDLREQVEELEELVVLNREHVASAELIDKLTSENSRAKTEFDRATVKLGEVTEQLELLREENSAVVRNRSELRTELNDMRKQVGILVEEKAAIATELEQAKTEVKAKEQELGKLAEQNSVLQQINKKMVDKLEEKSDEFFSLESENSNLRSESDQTVVKLGEVTKELDVLKDQNSTLFQIQSSLQSKVDDFGKELDILRMKISILEEEKVVLIERNSALQRATEKANDKSSDLEKKLEEKIAEVLSLKNSSKEVTEQINLLLSQKKELESQVAIINEKCTECQLSMKEFEDKLRSKILKQENSVANIESGFRDLGKFCRQLKSELLETRGKLDSEVTIRSSEVKSLMETRRRLEKSLELSQAGKLDAGKEVSKLQNSLQTLEVQLRLALQKLKITESQCKDKERVLRAEVAKLEEARKVQEERIKALSMILALSKHELNRIVKSVELGVNDGAERIYELETSFAEKHDCIESRLSVFVAEVASLKTELHNHLCEKQELNSALRELRLNTNEESVLALKFAAEELKTQLAERDKQIEQMLGRSVKCDERLKELEKMVVEKEEEILARNEEKREAIRQLCFLCEHYREVNDLLLERVKVRS